MTVLLLTNWLERMRDKVVFYFFWIHFAKGTWLREPETKWNSVDPVKDLTVPQQKTTQIDLPRLDRIESFYNEMELSKGLKNSEPVLDQFSLKKLQSEEAGVLLGQLLDLYSETDYYNIPNETKNEAAAIAEQLYALYSDYDYINVSSVQLTTSITALDETTTEKVTFVSPLESSNDGPILQPGLKLLQIF